MLSGRMAVLPAPQGIHSLALTDDARLLSAGRGGIRHFRLDLAALWARAER
ncbi:hypothetical protein [Streptomyces cyaneochromogenes]|uniref:hypothetical protein n=1 Tax=Streptomyces cyaneochromogenes TaxID=2496836 RepID=UPI00158E85C5|nr:hypothetical protein [Streptomyces cyaneochromogenes]